MSQAHNLLEIWDIYSKQVIAEKAPGKPAQKMSKKPGPKPMDLNDKGVQGFGQKDTGPAEAEGVQTKIVDMKTMTDKEKQQNPYNIKNFTLTDENFDKNIEKSSLTYINNNMNSIFDKLFEEVMDKDESAADLDALGIGGDEGMEGGDEGMEDMGGEEVTVTLTPDQVDCLRAILSQIEGGDMGDEDMGDEDLGGEDLGDEDLGGDEMDTEEDAEEKEEDYEHGMKEATEMKEVPDSAGQALTKHGHIKVGDKTAKLAKSGKADGKVTATVDGEGKDLPDSAGHSLTKHGNNKPKSKIKGGNQEFFGV